MDKKECFLCQTTKRDNLAKNIILSFRMLPQPTIRSVAKDVGISPTYVHYLIHNYIRFYFRQSYIYIMSIIYLNKKERYSRGGKSKKKKQGQD